MRRTALLIALLTSSVVLAQAQPIATNRVADDARVIDRMAEVSKHDLPRDLLRRLIDEDIDILRGRRADDTYQYAGYERMEQGRRTESYSVDPGKGDQLSKLEVRGSYAYRLLIASPNRRMLVTKNRRIYLDHAEIEVLPQGGRTSKVQNVKLGVWIEPGDSRVIELEDIARSATAKLFARAEAESGYGNLDISLLEARVFDDPNSPYADSVANLKTIRKSLDREDVASIRASAQRVAQSLGSPVTAPPSAPPARASVDVVASRNETALPSDMMQELQAIEDLLTGTDAERRQGADRLHQLLRRLRNPSH
jgi:hypothetical protein